MENTKERIVVHATELFARKGCKSITMDDIASSMGISKRTIYENFSNKDELVEACLNYFFEQHETNITSVLNSTDNIIDVMLRQMHDSSQMLRHVKFDFFNEIQKYFPNVYDSTVKKYKEQHLINSTKMLQKGQKDGVVRKDIDINLMAMLIHTLANETLAGSLFSDCNASKHDLMCLLMHNLTRGIVTPKGLDILDKYEEENKK